MYLSTYINKGFRENLEFPSYKFFKKLIKFSHQILSTYKICFYKLQYLSTKIVNVSKASSMTRNLELLAIKVTLQNDSTIFN